MPVIELVSLIHCTPVNPMRFQGLPHLVLLPLNCGRALAKREQPMGSKYSEVVHKSARTMINKT